MKSVSSMSYFLAKYGLDTNYLEHSKKDRKVLCENVIHDSLEKITAKIPMENKLSTLKRVLQSGIELNEKEENYEICLLLNDLLTAANNYVIQQPSQSDS